MLTLLSYNNPSRAAQEGQYAQLFQEKGSDIMSWLTTGIHSFSWEPCMALEEVGMSEKGKKKKKEKKRLNAFKGFATSVERLFGKGRLI